MGNVGFKKIGFIFIASFIFGVLISIFLINFSFSSKKTKTLPDQSLILNELINKCQNKSNCYDNELEKITLKYDYNFAFEILNKLVHDQPKFSYCHFMAHSIGHGAYEKDPQHWQTTLNKLPQECSYGASHGLLEQYAKSLHENNQSLISNDVMNKICKDQTSSCGHVLGHIVLVETKADAHKAITACHNLEGDYYRWCLNGVFMEYVYPQTLVQHGLVESSKLKTSGRLSEFSSFCSSFKEELVSSICWGEISRAAISEYGKNWENILGFCDSAPISESRRICKDRVIESLVVSTSFDIQNLKPLCSSYKLDNDFEKNCYIRLISGKMENDLVIEDEKGARFCLSLGQALYESCFKQIGNSVVRRNLKSTTVDIICKPAPSEYQDDCRGSKNT